MVIIYSLGVWNLAITLFCYLILRRKKTLFEDRFATTITKTATNHRSQGAFGAFIAEPRWTEYLDPYTLKPVETGANVILRNPFLPDIREFVVVMHDGMRLLDQNNQLIIDPVDGIILPPAEVEEDLLDRQQSQH